MPGLVPGIHDFSDIVVFKSWMAGTSPAMTARVMPEPHDWRVPHENGTSRAKAPFASGPARDYIGIMTPDTVPDLEAETPRIALWAAGIGMAALALTSGLLWWTQGTKVFIDTLAAGLAWCF